MATSTFRAGGLATGMDTNSIIEQLVALERRPLDLLEKKQSAFRSQVSALGSIASKLKLLGDAVEGLASGGVAAATVKSSNTSFSVTTGAGARPGRFNVDVEALARAASQRSGSFGTASAEVKAGTLDISAEGQNYQVTIAAGATLADVAYAIRQSGAPVTATVLDTGGGAYLQVTRAESGFDPALGAASALSITETSTGGTGTALGFTELAAATNANVLVDGLSFVRRTNDLTGVIDGVTISAKTLGAAEEVVIGSDAAATTTNVKKFVTAYNDLLKLVQLELNPTEKTNRETTLTGDPTMRSLQGRVQGLLSQTLGVNAEVRTLADIGLKTQRDGSLVLDSKRLEKVLAENPDALEGLFTDATTGLQAKLETLVEDYTDSVDGLLVTRQKGLGQLIDRIDDDIANGELRLASFEKTLVQRFTAMEKLVSSLNATGNFLAQQSAQLSKGDE